MSVEKTKAGLLAKKQRLLDQIAEKHKKHIAPLETLVRMTDDMIAACDKHQQPETATETES